MPNKKKKPAKSKPISNAEKLDLFKEKVMNTTWHHMQTEHSIKQLMCDLIDVIKGLEK